VLIGKINDRTRQKILVTIREVRGTKMVDLRVHQTSEDGELVATPAGVSLNLDQTEQAIELLKEAKKKVDAMQHAGEPTRRA
jgi:ACT domain-containing protein